jgi:hypothetical protein
MLIQKNPYVSIVYTLMVVILIASACYYQYYSLSNGFFPSLFMNIVEHHSILSKSVRYDRKQINRHDSGLTTFVHKLFVFFRLCEVPNE